MTEHTVATSTHGRYLVREGTGAGLLVGFHGYGENADRHLAELERLPGAEGWTLVAVQALNRFYNQRTWEVIASWMTKQDRELVIADNYAYAGAVLAELGPSRPLVFAGFSQGASMAYRAASAFPCDGLLVHGGDLPPDASAQEGVHFPPRSPRPRIVGRLVHRRKVRERLEVSRADHDCHDLPLRGRARVA
jgi:dienelactone hydrolase